MPEEQPAKPETESEIPKSASDIDTSQASGPSPQPNPIPAPTTKPDLPSSAAAQQGSPVPPADNKPPDTDSKTSQVAAKRSTTSASEAKRRLSKLSGKEVQPSEEVADSKIEAVVFQVWAVISKAIDSVWSAISSRFVESKLYGNLQDRLKPLQPVFKLFDFIWKRIIVPIWNNIVKPLWGLGLKFLRGRFSGRLKSFSDRFLTLIIVSILAILYWLFSALTSAVQPAVKKPLPAPVVTAPAPNPPNKPAPSPPSQPVTQPVPPVAEVPDLETPPPPQPEQKQIINVQTQVAQVFDQYSPDLIQSVQANFQAERLVIQVSDRWFELSQSEQNQLGTDALERSRKLNFPKLEIRDQKDQLLAREPVVGSNIIVLQRRTATPELMLDSPAVDSPA